MFQIPNADALVSYLKDFTGSTNDNEIKQCIFNCELSMRNIELPSLRTNPYETTGTVGQNQLMPIPADMNKPILFFMQGTGTSTVTATASGSAGSPVITLLPGSQQPNISLQVGATVSGTGIAPGAFITSFTSSTELVLSANNTGTVSGTVTIVPSSQYAANNGPWIVFDRIGDRDIITLGLMAQWYLAPVNVPAVIRGKFSEVGKNYQFLPYIQAGTVINMYYYRAWDLLFAPIYDGATQVGTVQTNEVLQSWPEGYVYGSLHEYYTKRRSQVDADMYKLKFTDAWKVVEDQNNLGKWSGGHTKLTSVFQPRRDRQFSIR